MPYIETRPYAAQSDTSRDAALRAKAFVYRQGLEVYRYLASCGSRGATQKEVSAALGIGRPSCCARFKALEDAGAIRKVEYSRRDGCTVYVKGGRVPEQLRLLA